jgi:type I restriction enzyme S subunit
MDGEFSIYIWGGEDSWINQRISRFSPKPGISHFFLIETLRPQLKAVESSEVATTVIHIGKNDYDKFFSLIPPRGVLDAFFHVSEPLFLHYVENLSGNKELSESRDVLLPKLMSGNLAILDINS